MIRRSFPQLPPGNRGRDVVLWTDCIIGIPVLEISIGSSPIAGPYPPLDYRASVQAGEFPGGTAPPNTFKEWYSWAAVAATASAAGLVVHVPAIDANKNDVRVETWGTWEGRARSIGLPLKSTSTPAFVGPLCDLKASASGILGASLVALLTRT